MSEFKVGDKAVVKYDALHKSYKEYEGQIGSITWERKYFDSCGYVHKIEFINGESLFLDTKDILPFTGFKVGDIVDRIDPIIQLQPGGHKINEVRIGVSETVYVILGFLFQESELKYHHSHFEKETNMLDKEKLHKLVDRIDSGSWRAHTYGISEAIMKGLESLQKEKTLEEKLEEAGYTSFDVYTAKDNNIYIHLNENECSVLKWHSARTNQALNCPLDFDEIMATIKFLESRK